MRRSFPICTGLVLALLSTSAAYAIDMQTSYTVDDKALKAAATGTSLIGTYPAWLSGVCCANSGADHNSAAQMIVVIRFAMTITLPRGTCCRASPAAAPDGRAAAAGAQTAA